MKKMIGLGALASLAALFSVTPSQAQTTPACNSSNSTAVALSSSVTICGVASTYANPALQNQNPVPAPVPIVSYAGIQYGQAARWAAPQAAPLPANNTTMNSFGSICPQNQNIPVTPNSSNYQAQNEACLYLNIWKPATTRTSSDPLPVMVFIHGGAFVEGAGSDPLYNGSAFAAQGVILVTLNYRLGALGFLAADNIQMNGSTVSPAGNFGIMDQQLALQWVKANISAFGGDPQNVTVFGESAGAMSVALHIQSIPTSNSKFNTNYQLFQSAIMESNPVISQYNDAATAASNGKTFVNTLCKSTNTCDDLSKITASQILSTQKNWSPNTSINLKDIVNVSLTWSPTIDGSFIVEEPLSTSAWAEKTPVVFGVNNNEGTLFSANSYAKSPSVFNDILYLAFISLVFHDQSGTIDSQAAYEAKTYKPYVVNNATILNGVGYALGQIMTDYGFACGNLALANTLYSQWKTINGKGNPIYPTMYGYQFTQPPIYDVYGTSTNGGQACSTSAPNNVCHGSELAYVFGTLANYVPTTATGYQANITLANQMNTAWAGFAKDQSNATGFSSYQPYNAQGSTGGAVTQWNSSKTSPVTLDTQANCSNIWFNANPYKSLGTP